MHSRSGYSGSPVFVYRTPGSDFVHALERVGQRSHVLLDNAVLMLPLGIHIGQFPEIWKIKGVATAAIPAETAELTATESHIEGVSGMTCVAPMSAIVKLLTLPGVVKPMKRTEEKLAAQATRPTVVTPETAGSERLASAIEGDDQHKERFTALLDAVAGEPKPAG